MEPSMELQLSNMATSRSMPTLTKSATQRKPRFTSVYTEHKHTIYTYVLLRVGYDREIAEDVTSDVFLKAYRNFDRYNPEYALSTWLFTITRNTLIDHYRKGKEVIDIDGIEVEDEKDALYQLLTHEFSERDVREAIEALPEQQRICIEEQFLAGKNAKEVAEQLGISHAAARKHVSRGGGDTTRSSLVGYASDYQSNDVSMSNPFRQQMPSSTDLKIRVRLFHAWLSDHKLIGAGVLMVPAFALWMFMVLPQSPTPIDTVALVATIEAAQAEELQKAEGAIYHVVREITEGSDKPAFVRSVLGNEVDAPKRVDRVETYQHSDTALALIESNGTKQPFEAFLSREHEDGNLALHHYGPAVGKISDTRASYDEAHDLASLYTAYTSLERPSIPVLAPEAEFVDVTEGEAVARFSTTLSDTITVESFVDIETNLIAYEVIYVFDDAKNRYEMTRIEYLERNVIAAGEFDNIFDPEQFDYDVIDVREFLLSLVTLPIS